MTKTEFLNLDSGERQWILLRCLQWSIRLLYRLTATKYDVDVEDSMARVVLDVATQAAQEEATLE